MTSPKLCLGTVQLGSKYGITNTSGRPTVANAMDILNAALLNNVCTFDTAPAYGDSEKILGEFFLNKKNEVKIITKIPSGTSTEQELNLTLSNTFAKLKTKSIDTVLFHSSSDLMGPTSNELLYSLKNYKDQGLLNRVGVSIYSPSELENLPISELDVIQLPLSIYDQRFLIDKTIDRLHDKGISVHARSVFLQGIILSSVNNLPSWFSRTFINHHEHFLAFCESMHMSALDMSLSFILEQEKIEYFLVGAEKKEQLLEIISSMTKFRMSNISWKQFVFEDDQVIDPRCWP